MVDWEEIPPSFIHKRGMFQETSPIVVGVNPTPRTIFTSVIMLKLFIRLPLG